MTENSEDRTKRKLVNYLLDYELNYQYSIFPLLSFIDYEVDCEDAKTSILHRLKEIKRKLKYNNKDTAILFRIRRLRKYFDYFGQSRPIDQIYITLFASQNLDMSWLDINEFNLLNRKLSTYKIIKHCQAILHQNINNLNDFSNIPLKKYTFISKQNLIQRSESLRTDLIENYGN